MQKTSPNDVELEDEIKDIKKKIKVTYYKNIQKNLVSKIAMSEELERRGKDSALKNYKK